MYMSTARGHLVPNNLKPPLLASIGLLCASVYMYTCRTRRYSEKKSITERRGYGYVHFTDVSQEKGLHLLGEFSRFRGIMKNCSYNTLLGLY